MKLAAIYNVFDGEELIEGSIKQIYPYIDELIIVYQTVSNFGNKYDNSATLKRIQKNYKCMLLEYVPNLHLGRPGANNETFKRKSGLDRARQLGCTHALFIDCDEYYMPSEFESAKAEIEKHGYDGTACHMYTYYKEPIYRVEPPETYFVPFIFEVKEAQHVGGGYKVYCDPTRSVSPVKRFKELDIMMHHFSYVRNDIGRKLNNSSAKTNFKDIPKMVKSFDSWELGDDLVFFDKHTVKVVENLFSI